MRVSISSRVFFVVLLGMFSMLMIILLLAWRQLEAMEEAFIDSFAQAELAYFAQYGVKDTAQNIQSAQLISVYVPNHLVAKYPLPNLFVGRTAPFRGEVEALGRMYAVNVHRFDEGVHYYAQDLAIVEEAEDTLHILVVSGAIIIVLLSLFNAWLAARHISKPVVRLVAAIKQAQEGNCELPADQFREIELQTIGTAVNHLVEQNKAATEREKNWMAMASHEFRTPLSIMSGAVSVLQKRASLSGEDSKTLGRIERACQDMTGYVEALLAIARRSPQQNPQPVDIAALAGAAKAHFASQHEAWSARISLSLQNPGAPLGDATVIKIALNNLLLNALTHTQGEVWLEAHGDHLAVIDTGNASCAQASGGLGLYIVNMACVYLGWRLSIEPAAGGRRCVLWYPQSPKTQPLKSPSAPAGALF